MTGLHEWWSGLQSLGPSYGYFVNASKTWLIVKPEYLDVARELFKNTSIGITSEDRRHLGASIGSREFTSDYVNEKVKSWIACLLTLSKIGILCLYTWSGKQMDIFSSNDSKYSDLLKPLEDVIFHHFIPVLVG